MAASLRAAGTWSERTTNTTVAIPAGSAAGDRMYLLASWKDFAITASVSGWTELVEGADGTTGSGNGTGSMKVGVWYKDHSGSESNPTLTFSTTTGLLAQAVIVTFQKGATEQWDTPIYASAAITNWTTTAQTVSAGGTSFPAAAGVVIGVAGIRDDSATFTRPTTGISSSAGTITWSGNYVESPATHASTTTGNDMSCDAGHRFFTGASGSITLTQTATLSAAETGMAMWVIQTVTPVASLSQVAYRGRNDDGNETTATWKAAQNTNWTQDTDEVFRFRAEIQEGNAVAQAQDYTLEYDVNGGGYQPVGTSGTAVLVASSPNITDSVATTNQLTAGTGTFTAGEIDESTATKAGLTVAASGHTELEYVLKLNPSLLVAGDVVHLRVYKGAIGAAVPLNTYTVTPNITVSKPSRTTGVAQISLGPLAATPPAGTQAIHVRARLASGIGSLRIQVYEGATQRYTGDHTLSSSFATFTPAVTGVTNWSNLEVRVQGIAAAGYQLVPEVSWIRFAAPAASGPALIPISLPAGLTLTPVIARVGQYKKAPAVTMTLTAAMSRKKFDLEQLSLSMATVVSLIRKKQTTIPAGLTLTGGITLQKKVYLALSAGLTMTAALVKKGQYFKTLAATATNTPAITMRMTRLRALAGILTLDSVLNRRVNKPVAAGLTLTPNISFGKFLQKPLSAGLTMTSAVIRMPLKALAATVTNTPAISIRMTRLRLLAATLTMTTVLSPRWTGYRLLAANLTMNGAITRRLSRSMPVSATLTPVITLLKLKLITLPANLTMTATLALKAGVSKLLAVTMTMTPTLNKALSKPLSANLTLTPVIVKKGTYYKLLALTMTLSPNVATRKTAYQALAATITFTAQQTMIRTLKLQLAGNLPLTTALNRRLNKTLNASLNLAGVVQADKLVGIRFISLPATVNLGVAMVKVLAGSRLLSASVVLDTTLTRLKVAPRLLAAPVSLGVALKRSYTRTLAVTVTTNPVITPLKMKFVTIAATITNSVVLTKLTTRYRAISANLTLTPIIAPLNKKRLDAGLTLTPVVKRNYFKTLAVSLLTNPVLDKLASNGQIVLDAVISMNAKVEKAFPKKLQVALNLQPVISFQHLIMRFRDWLLGAKMDEPVLDSAELDEPELLAATYVGEE